ncbi:DUF4225 domain-containing protein [Erwinia sorbitola]|uniref:DUF4225 domain-containing protein n=1 Tax=Erwinia sorbitola TaxID=2681984 RepID=A0A6I6EJA5_9GAMM|nr:DUF4225 domain-containing protein [Erwinia sorbitola]QGU89834.1 DUF4225 domain-containing protein [Erwinia sorbitola]
MDAVLLDMMRSGGRNKSWAEKMVNLEARKLLNTANMLSAFHLQDGLTRMKFVQEIKEVIERQFAAALQAESDEECMACIKILRAETDNLEEQGRMLRTKAAKLYAKVDFVRKNNKIVGYVISAVNVVLSGAEIALGVTLLASANPLGVLAGAVLVTDGLNGLSKEFSHHVLHDSISEGFAANATMSIAEFMGFSSSSGLGVYNSISLVANAYSILGLVKKPGTWRLFRYIPINYYRKVSVLSRPKLTMKIVGYGVKAKVIFDLMTFTDRPQS